MRLFVLLLGASVCAGCSDPSPARPPKPEHAASAQTQQAALHAKLVEAWAAERWTEAEVLTQTLIALDDPKTPTLRATLPHLATHRDIARRLSQASILASLASWDAFDFELAALSTQTLTPTERQTLTLLAAQRPAAPPTLTDPNPAGPETPPPASTSQTAPP